LSRSGLRAPAGAPVRVSTSRSITRSAAKASISRTRSVSARFSISSRRAILASVIVVSWFRFKLRNSNPNRRPAVTAPGVRCAQQGFAHALSGSVLHHARGHYGPDDPPRVLFELAGRLGAKRALRDLGMPQDGIERVVEQTMATPYPNPRPLDASAIRELIFRAGKGEPPP